MAESETDLDAAIELARSLLQAYEAKDWTTAAKQVHDTALAQFREMQLAMAQAWEERPTLAGERDPTMPAEVAAYFDSVHTDRGNPLLHFFPRVSTLAELRALTPTEFLARFMEGNDPKPENYDDHRPPVFTREVIGAVPEGDSLAHVVYRIHSDMGRGGQTQEVEVMTVRRANRGWRALLNRDIAVIGTFEVRAWNERL
jgi:hypothetical protein